MRDQQLDDLFIKFLLEVFPEELRGGDLKKIVYSDPSKPDYWKNKIKSFSQFEELTELFSKRDIDVEDLRSISYYIIYIFKKKLDVNILSDKNLLSYFLDPWRRLTFNFLPPMDEDMYEISLDYEMLKAINSSKVYFINKTIWSSSEVHPIIDLQNVSKGIISQNIALSFDSCSDFTLKLPDNITRIEEHAMTFSNYPGTILFTPKGNDVGFDVAFSDADHLKKLLKPIN